MNPPVRIFLISDSPVCGDLSPEVMGVGPNSVTAVVGGRNDNRQHLSLTATQRGTAAHEGIIEIH
jgi:hypothetical protein